MSTKLCPYCAEEIKFEAIRCRYCQSWLAPPPPGATTGGRGWWGAAGIPDKGAYAPLRRPTTGRMIAGVCAGFARFLGVDPTLVRVGYLVLTVMTLGLPGVALYALLAFVIPSEGDDRLY